jgi:hypothetical protein
MVDGPTAADIKHAAALKADGNSLLKIADYMRAG